MCKLWELFLQDFLNNCGLLMLVCLYSNPCRNCKNFDPKFPVPRSAVPCSLCYTHT
ncbi:hypothetical protein [Moorena producens]|uniref:hypothetical protein n=1 Tax=Moorena producens TaxID=1155739 RepID=UPI003C723179